MLALSCWEVVCCISFAPINLYPVTCSSHQLCQPTLRVWSQKKFSYWSKIYVNLFIDSACMNVWKLGVSHTLTLLGQVAHVYSLQPKYFSFYLSFLSIWENNKLADNLPLLYSACIQTERCERYCLVPHPSCKWHLIVSTCSCENETRGEIYQNARCIFWATLLA